MPSNAYAVKGMGNGMGARHPRAEEGGESTVEIAGLRREHGAVEFPGGNRFRRLRTRSVPAQDFHARKIAPESVMDSRRATSASGPRDRTALAVRGSIDAWPPSPTLCGC